MLNRIRFGAVAAAFATILSAATAKAEIYTEYVKGTDIPSHVGMVTPTPSNLGLSINLANLVSPAIPNTATLPGSFLIVDKSLDSSGNGTLYFKGGQLTLENFSYNISLGFLGSVVATGNNVGFTFTSTSPIQVTNNAFSITNGVTGSLSINTGSISLVGTVLGSSIDTSLDFDQEPVTQEFSGLTAAIPGRADTDGSGSDTDTQTHIGYNLQGGVPDPGLSGVSPVSTIGAETFINYNGFSIATTITSGSLTLPTTITITGSTTVSVPEVSSVALIGASVVGLGVIARRRRSA